MSADAPLSGPASAAAADGPFPSMPDSATDWIDPRLRQAYALVSAVYADHLDVAGDLQGDLQKAMDKIEEADALLELVPPRNAV